jgi:hypothetical protein
MASNYPPGYSGGIDYTDNEVPQKCKNEHIWTAAMYSELGGFFFCDEDKGPICPVCGEECLDEIVDPHELVRYKALGNIVLHQGKSMVYQEDDYLGED